LRCNNLALLTGSPSKSTTIVRYPNSRFGSGIAPAAAQPNEARMKGFYLLFFALIVSKATPRFFAIENVDTFPTRRHAASWRSLPGSAERQADPVHYAQSITRWAELCMTTGSFFVVS
jgi:hypothetical protein